MEKAVENRILLLLQFARLIATYIDATFQLLTRQSGCRGRSPDAQRPSAIKKVPGRQARSKGFVRYRSLILKWLSQRSISPQPHLPPFDFHRGQLLPASTCAVDGRAAMVCIVHSGMKTRGKHRVVIIIPILMRRPQFTAGRKRWHYAKILSIRINRNPGVRGRVCLHRDCQRPGRGPTRAGTCA